jgi:hypothetical protein
MEILFQKGQAVNALKHVVVSVKNRTEIKEEEANMTTVRRNVALGGFTVSQFSTANANSMRCFRLSGVCV